MEDDGEWQHVESAIIPCADLDNLPFYRRTRIPFDPIGIARGLVVCHFPRLSPPCGAFRSLTPGPSPFSSTKITPADSRAARMAMVAANFGKLRPDASCNMASRSARRSRKTATQAQTCRQAGICIAPCAAQTTQRQSAAPQDSLFPHPLKLPNWSSVLPRLCPPAQHADSPQTQNGPSLHPRSGRFVASGCATARLLKE